MNNNTLSNERNYGIDALRMVSMCLVVILHILSQGGVLDTTQDGSARHLFMWFIEICAYCAVDVYALITGYVMVKSKPKLYKIIELTLQVLFWSCVITVLFAIFVPDSVSTREFITMFIPKWWYYVAYVEMFFFLPYCNVLIQQLDRNSMKKLVVTIVILLSILPTLFHRDICNTNDGYSMLWLIGLYFIGAYIRLFFENNKRHICLKSMGSYFIFALLMLLSKAVFEAFG